MHLRFTFESLNTLNSPGEYMRYCRGLRGLTTRQLAEKLNIVPATVLAYEQGRFPIPYELSVVATQMLQIPESLLFDDYCVFISVPYTEYYIQSESVMDLTKLILLKMPVFLQVSMRNGRRAAADRQEKCISN